MKNGAGGKARRMKEVEARLPKIGDRIIVRHYTATCQEVTPRGAIFLMDRYLDRRYPMNIKNTNRGGYDNSDLRKYLQSDTVLSDFEEIRPYMKPWNNGDLLRIPYYGEMFGDNLPSWVKPDGHEQWPLMTDAHNRAASRCGEPEWGWLANTVCDTSTHFCVVGNSGLANDWGASSVIGVRPVFMLSQEKTCYDMENGVCTSESACKDSNKKNKEVGDI